MARARKASGNQSRGCAADSPHAPRRAHGRHPASLPGAAPVPGGPFRAPAAPGSAPLDSIAPDFGGPAAAASDVRLAGFPDASPRSAAAAPAAPRSAESPGADLGSRVPDSADRHFADPPVALHRCDSRLEGQPAAARSCVRPRRRPTLPRSTAEKRKSHSGLKVSSDPHSRTTISGRCLRHKTSWCGRNPDALELAFVAG